MKRVRASKIWCISVLFACLGAVAQAALAQKPLTANEIVNKAAARAQNADSKSGPAGYTYTKLSVTEELDSTGKVRERKEKVYDVSFQGGSTHLKLLSVNGRPPASADLKKQSENDGNARQLFGSSTPHKGDNRENFLTPEIVSRFDFTLTGQKAMNGRTAYQISFSPKRPTPPSHHILDRFLDRI